MWRLSLFFGFILIALGFNAEGPGSKDKWDFDATKLAKKVCAENQWLFEEEFVFSVTRTSFAHFKFFRAVKPIDETTGNEIILVISADRQDYILHQSIKMEEIAAKESFYPKDKDEARDMATLQEELTPNYDQWSLYYSIESVLVEEDKDNLIWRVTFNYSRSDLWAIVVAIGPNEKPARQIVPAKDAPPFPEERYLTRIVQLTHPLRFEIQKLIDLLGNDDWEVREKATNDLLAMGRPAVSLLKATLNNPDPEVRMRAKLILENIK